MTLGIWRHSLGSASLRMTATTAIFFGVAGPLSQTAFARMWRGKQGEHP